MWEKGGLWSAVKREPVYPRGCGGWLGAGTEKGTWQWSLAQVHVLIRLAKSTQTHKQKVLLVKSLGNKMFHLLQPNALVKGNWFSTGRKKSHRC